MPTQHTQILIDNNAVLVHCSSQTVLVGNAYTRSLGPLERIYKAMLGNAVVCCSTIIKGDQVIANYTGCVGIIVSPKLSTSITYASWLDNGSNPYQRELTRNQGSVLCAPTDLEAAILGRSTDSYNEIFVHTYKSLGIFLSRPVQFNVPEGIFDFSDKELYSAFPGIDFYECNNGEFCRLDYNFTKNQFVVVNKCSISNIYA